MTAIQTANGALNPREIQIYRNLVKTSIVVIVLWRLGRPSGPTELAKILGISRETVASYLDSLNMIGLVTRTDHKGGFRLTDDGRQLMLHVPAGYILDETHAPTQEPHVLTLHIQTEGSTTSKALLPGKATSEKPTFVDGSFSAEDGATSEIPTLLPASFGDFDIPTSGIPTLGRATSENPTFNVGNSDVAPLKTLKKEEESLILKDSDSSTSFLKSGNVEIFDVRGALIKTDMLFDNQVFTQGLEFDALDPDIVLGWLAQAYDQRKRLYNAPGLVYLNLKNKDVPLPKKCYLESPENYLPNDFLCAIGITPPEREREADKQCTFGIDAWTNDEAPPETESSQAESPEKTSRKEWIRDRLELIGSMRAKDQTAIPAEFVDEYRALTKELWT